MAGLGPAVGLQAFNQRTVERKSPTHSGYVVAIDGRGDPRGLALVRDLLGTLVFLAATEADVLGNMVSGFFARLKFRTAVRNFLICPTLSWSATSFSEFLLQRLADGNARHLYSTKNRYASPLLFTPARHSALLTPKSW